MIVNNYPIMLNNLPKSHLYLPEDLPILETNHTFSASSIWLKLKMDKQIATYDLFVRDMPAHRNFLLFGGLEEIIQDIKNWRYTSEQISYLENIGVLNPEMKSYLKNFKFTGDLYAMPEGTVFFPGEPIIRLTAPIIEASLFTLYFPNVVTSHTIFFSKAIRSILMAPGKTVLGGGVRAHSFETNAKAVRALYLCGGGLPTSTAGICYKYNIPVSETPTFFGQHAFIKSFDQEIEAMRAFADNFPNQTAFMVDTYNFKQGLKNAITVGLDLKKNGHKLRFIVVDSGDLVENTKMARRELDKAGLDFVKIIVCGNIDEYKLKKLMAKKTPGDVFHVVTELNSCSDSPKLEIVYKLAHLRDGKKEKHTAKLAPGKLSLPGQKQVFRDYSKGKIKTDCIGLADEKLGQPLLRPIFRSGKLVYPPPTTDQTRSYIKYQVKTLPNKLRAIDQEHKFPVAVSPKLKKLLKSIAKEKTGKDFCKGDEVYNIG